MNKIFIFLASLIICSNTLVAQSGGSIGSTGLRWDFDGVNTLTISATAGIETMPNYNETSNRPDWETHKDKIKSVIIEDGIASIGHLAFYNHGNLNSVEISSSVTSIGGWVFDGCTSLTHINIPNSVTSMGFGVFNNCTSLTHINIPNSVTSIGNLTFYNCTSLTQINIPNSVTSIGIQTFESCTSLTHINIPNSVNSIRNVAFQYCTSLTSIILHAETPPTTFDNSAFHNIYSTPLTLYVPAQSKHLYDASQSTAPWDVLTI